MKSRTVMVGLDGFTIDFAERLMDEGRMPNLAKLREESARWLVDDSQFRNANLTYEQISSGLRPDESKRWSAVEFDRESYAAVQAGAANPPFTAPLDAKTVVFDAPYFDIARDTNARGVVGWGAHDPGLGEGLQSRPASLADEVVSRFGDYAAKDYIYGFLWPDADLTLKAGRLLRDGVDQRTRIVRWLFGERITDWDLAISVVAAAHSATEPMWHGIDESHPLNSHPSAAVARQCLEEIYEAIDRHIGAIREIAPDATIVCFTMHGMGANNSDVPAMLLLPEMMYRLETGKTLFEPQPEWRAAADGVPIIPPGVPWDRAILGSMRGGQVMRIRDRIQRDVQKLRRKLTGTSSSRAAEKRDYQFPLKMAATRYAKAWPKMRAFGFPTFHDGRIRINLKGREKHGIVSPAEYEAVVSEYVAMLKTLKDPRTGEAAIGTIYTPVLSDPLSASDNQADIVASFNGTPLALEHPGIGTVGPAPFRRTGAHTGGLGALFISGESIARGDYGECSGYDIVPTVCELAGSKIPLNRANSIVLPYLSQAA